MPVRACVAVDVRLEISPGNSRILAAAVDVRAPVDVVWECLTDYERLHEFIPGLVVNECLERREKGALLKQVGEQDVAMGLKFCARAVLEVAEHLTGLADNLCWELSGPNALEPTSCTMWDESLGLYPCAHGIEHGRRPRDISFNMVDGDFQDFRGLWRMQGDEEDPDHTRLSYSVFVRPQKWLPVALIERRIVRESRKNLVAVGKHAQNLSAARSEFMSSSGATS
ncbi:unnamed protein product [Ostreobium quekettii]|uniref:Coenzyme Q-binding protein COQ10 START domain-containing protein n=1 Tax=Ostreobium quekettii TaxID=121088 RepID=A0A8S1ILV7_9CHLO|nr:unnamed protein product [Ostreobium quekettii]